MGALRAAGSMRAVRARKPRWMMAGGEDGGKADGKVEAWQGAFECEWDDLDFEWTEKHPVVSSVRASPASSSCTRTTQHQEDGHRVKMQKRIGEVQRERWRSGSNGWAWRGDQREVKEMEIRGRLFDQKRQHTRSSSPQHHTEESSNSFDATQQRTRPQTRRKQSAPSAAAPSTDVESTDPVPHLPPPFAGECRIQAGTVASVAEGEVVKVVRSGESQPRASDACTRNEQPPQARCWGWCGAIGGMRIEVGHRRVRW